MPDELLKTIGRVAVAFAQLEYALAVAIKRTSDLSLQEAEKLARGLSFDRLADRAREDFHKWESDPKTKKHFSGLLDRTKKAARVRNDIVHGVWCRDAAGNPAYQRKNHPVSYDDDAKLAERITELDELVAEAQEITSGINRTTRDVAGVEALEEYVSALAISPN